MLMSRNIFRDIFVFNFFMVAESQIFSRYKKEHVGQSKAKLIENVFDDLKEKISSPCIYYVLDPRYSHQGLFLENLS